MILPDANLLLYAYDSASPFHRRAASWWSRCLSGQESVGFSPSVLFAFVRIGTSAKAFGRPMPVETAAKHVRTWLAQPVSRLVDMQAQDVETALNLLGAAGAGGNLTTDAQIAALALRLRAIVHTADADFGRFPKVKWFNPILAK